MANGAGSPNCTILGGPNGAGKSTIYDLIDRPGDFINADVIARDLSPQNPESVSLLAGKEVLRLLDEKLLSRSDFTYETTLSSHQSINIIKRARLSGFQVGLVFVALQDSDLHVERVSNRVLKGGHDIPEETIRRRYGLAFDNLIKAIPLSHEVAIFDNSDKVGPRIVIEIADGVLVRSNLNFNNSFDQRIATCVASALGLRPEEVLGAGLS
jgi:predicted ABC-type ATPase